MKKLIYLFLIFMIVVGVDFGLSKTNIPVNENSYLLGFEHFRSHSEKTLGQKRIILVGGSSLAWGISAKRLSSDLGRLTLNAGIHAGVGFRHFIRNIEDVVDKEHDILVISPEYALVSKDFKFSRSHVFCQIALYVRRSYPLECVGYSLNAVFRVSPILDRTNAEFNRYNFNDFGDYEYRVAGRNLVGQMGDKETCLDNWQLSDLNDNYMPYMKTLKEKGYTIVYLPNFIPSTACSKKDKVRQFHDILFEEFGITGHKEIKLFFDEKYFYDTVYHLTHDGVDKKTDIFLKHLRSYFLSQ